MNDRGFFITRHAIRRQLAAMPNELYLIRLIHQQSRKAFPGERLWTATQLQQANAIRFLRARNCEGCDVYIYPYAGNQNAGYILADLDSAEPAVLDRMRADGLTPCVVLQTSPGHLQAWIHLSTTPLEPAVASAAGKQLARAYGGDWASTDWPPGAPRRFHQSKTVAAHTAGFCSLGENRACLSGAGATGGYPAALG